MYTGCPLFRNVCGTVLTVETVTMCEIFTVILPGVAHLEVYSRVLTASRIPLALVLLLLLSFFFGVLSWFA